MRLLRTACVAILLIVLLVGTSTAVEGHARYLFQLQPNSTNDIVYLEQLVKACADKEKALPLKSAYHRDIKSFGVVSASLTANCYQEIVVKNPIVQNLVRLVEIDHPLTSLVKVAQPPTENPNNEKWHLQRLNHNGTDYTKTANPGKGVHVYSLDAGTYLQHPDFKDIGHAGYAVPADAAEECRATADPPGASTSDRASGTLAAGLAVGKTTGLATAATLVSVRVFACEGQDYRGHVSGLLSGLEYVHRDYATVHNASAPAVAAITVGAPYSRILNNAATQLVKAGITVVAGAGHAASFPAKQSILDMTEATSNACYSSPASALGVISVGATLYNDTIAPFSNTGGCVTLYAPGSTVTTTNNIENSPTIQTSGTGASAAVVAGLAAMFLGSAPTSHPHVVRQYLVDSSRLEQNLTTSVTTAAPMASKFALPRLATFGLLEKPHEDTCKKSNLNCVHGLPFLLSNPARCKCVCQPGFIGNDCSVELNVTSQAQPRVQKVDAFKTLSPLASALNATGKDLPSRRSSSTAFGGIDYPGFPLNSFGRYQRMQSLYLASELKAAEVPVNSVLSALAYRVFAPISEDIDDVIISIGFVPPHVVSLSTFVPTVQVFRGKISAATSAATTADALVPFAFETIGGADLPKWDGVSNLVVEYAATNQIIPEMLKTANVQRRASGAVYLASTDGGFSRSLFAYALNDPETTKLADSVYPFTDISLSPISSRFVPVLRLLSHGPQSQCLTKTPPRAGKCGSKGICVDATGACVCEHGFTGPTCHEIDTNTNALCVPSTSGADQKPKCQNGGYCVQGTCECTNGYFGATCAEAPRSFCALHSNHCGDHGVCVDNGACICQNGYSGSKCQVKPFDLGPHTETEKKCVNLGADALQTLTACQVKGTSTTEKFVALEKLSCALYGAGSPVSEECSIRISQLIDCITRVTKPSEAYEGAENAQLITHIQTLVSLRESFSPRPLLTVSNPKYAQPPVEGKPNVYTFGSSFTPKTTEGVKRNSCIESFTAGTVNVTAVNAGKIAQILVNGFAQGEMAFIRESEYSCGDVRSLLKSSPPNPHVFNYTVTPAPTQSNPAVPVGVIANFTTNGLTGLFVPCIAHSTDAPFALVPGARLTVKPTTAAPANTVTAMNPSNFPIFDDAGQRDVLVKHTSADMHALFGKRVAFSDQCSSPTHHVVSGFMTPPRLNPLTLNMQTPVSFIETEEQMLAMAKLNAFALDTTLLELSAASPIDTLASIRLALPFGVKSTYKMCILDDDGSAWVEQQDKLTNLQLGQTSNIDPGTAKDLCLNRNCGVGRCVAGACICDKLYTQSEAGKGVCDTPPPAVPEHAVRVRFLFAVPQSNAQAYTLGSNPANPSPALQNLSDQLALAAGIPAARIKVRFARLTPVSSFLELEAEVDAEVDAEIDADMDAYETIDTTHGSSFISLSQRFSVQNAVMTEVVVDILPPLANEPTPKNALDALEAIKAKKQEGQLNLAEGVSMETAAVTCPDGTDPAVTNCGANDWCEENVSMSCIWFGVLIGSIAVALITVIIVLVFCTGKEEEFVPAALSGQNRPSGRAVLDDEDDEDAEAPPAQKRTFLNGSQRSDGAAPSRRQRGPGNHS